VVSSTPRPQFTLGKDPVPTVKEAGWAPGPVWTGEENLAPTGIRTPDRPARSQSLYRLSYLVHTNRNEYQEYFLGSKGGRCVGLTTLPPLCADCLENWEPQFPGPLWPVQTCTWIALPSLRRQMKVCELFRTLSDRRTPENC
jgi:hypothetical protein